MSQWYYAKNGQHSGPVEKAVIQELFDKNEISADDLIWESGMSDWVPADSLFNKSANNQPPPTVSSAPPLPPAAPEPKLPDYGNFLCWGIALVLIPYLNTVVLIVLAILICLELSAAQRKINEGKLPASTYGNLHPVVGFLLVFCCQLLLYPFLMHWRNKSGYFKQQPHAVWFSIVIFVFAILVGIGALILFASMGMLSGHHYR
jgi:hypothetical protein